MGGNLYVIAALLPTFIYRFSMTLRPFLVLYPGKAALITVGGLAAGATVGSAVVNFLQVDIVPFLGIHSPAVVVSEFILFSQLLVSLFVR